MKVHKVSLLIKYHIQHFDNFKFSYVIKLNCKNRTKQIFKRLNLFSKEGFKITKLLYLKNQKLQLSCIDNINVINNT